VSAHAPAASLCAGRQSAFSRLQFSSGSTFQVFHSLDQAPFWIIGKTKATNFLRLIAFVLIILFSSSCSCFLHGKKRCFYFFKIFINSKATQNLMFKSEASFIT